MGKTTSPGDHGEEKSGEGVGQRNGIWGGWRGKWDRLGDARAEADLLEEGDETAEAAKRRHRLGRLRHQHLGTPEKRGKRGRFSFVVGLLGVWVHPTYLPQITFPFPPLIQLRRSGLGRCFDVFVG
jgi:hypothetical protein